VEQRFHEWLVAASIEEQFRAALAGYHFLQARQVLMTFQALPIPATEPKFADRRARWLASARLSFDLAQEHFYQKYLLQMSESLNSVLAHPQLIDPLVWKAQVITAWDKSGINLDAWRSSDGQFPLQDALQEKVQIIVRLREAKEKASMLARAAALEALLATQEDEGAQAAPESAATQQPQQPDEIEAPATMPSSPPLQLEPATPSSETQARNARQSLLRQVQADAPEATAEWLSDSIRLIYETSSTESDWSKGWRVKSPQALDGWQLTSWRLEWANPEGRAVLPELTWLQDIQISGSDGWAGGVVRVGRSVIYRFPIIQGTTQLLAWDGTTITLDGLKIADWKPTRRVASGRMRGQSKGPFRPARVIMAWSKSE
ncbi:MAG: hypothetical protein HOM77_00105, partial [Planctomycetes bacterium]|nr:hypothetical protein [Planctomycetota bacterium]